MAGLATLVNLLFTFYTFVIIGRVFLSWTNMIDPYHPVAQWIYRLTEPLLRPIRDMLPQSGMYDWSPAIAMIIVFVARYIVLWFLYSL
jgi:YggT family protein